MFIYYDFYTLWYMYRVKVIMGCTSSQLKIGSECHINYDKTYMHCCQCKIIYLSRLFHCCNCKPGHHCYYCKMNSNEN